MQRAIFRFAILSVIVSSIGPWAGSIASAQELKTIWVAHRRVDCIGVAPQKCYLIKSNQYEDWKFWYGEIEGFDFEEGYAYELLVREVRVEDPPADASSIELQLVEVLLRVEAHDPGGDRQPPPAPAAPDPMEPETTEVETAPAPPPPAPVATPVPPVTEPVEPTPPAPTPAPAATPAPAPTPPPAPATPAAAPPPATTSPAAPPPAAPPPAPVGQEYRGHLTIGAGIEARSFKLCGSEESIWVEDRTDHDLWATYRQMTQFPNRPLFMIVRGEVEAPPPSGFGAHYPQQLLIRDLRHAATESAGCFGDLDRLQFRASGNEPSWTLEISTRGLALTEMGEDGRTLFPYTQPDFSGGQIVYRSRTGGNNPRSLQITLREQRCNDTMVDALYSFTAEVQVDGRALAGCAVEGGARP